MVDDEGIDSDSAPRATVRWKEFLRIAQEDAGRALYAAATGGCLEEVRVGIVSVRHPDWYKTPDGCTALCAAAAHGHTEVVVALASAGASVNMTLPAGIPLHRAAEGGHADTVGTLIVLGADALQTLNGVSIHAVAKTDAVRRAIHFAFSPAATRLIQGWRTQAHPREYILPPPEEAASTPGGLLCAAAADALLDALQCRSHRRVCCAQAGREIEARCRFSTDARLQLKHLIPALVPLLQPTTNGAAAAAASAAALAALCQNNYAGNAETLSKHTNAVGALTELLKESQCARSAAAALAVVSAVPVGALAVLEFDCIPSLVECLRPDACPAEAAMVLANVAMGRPPIQARILSIPSALPYLVAQLKPDASPKAAVSSATALRQLTTAGGAVLRFRPPEDTARTNSVRG